MKQIMAVMNPDDSCVVMREMAKAGYSSTSIDSRGGFLGKPNMTVFAVVEDMRVRDVTRIIEENTRSREYDMPDGNLMDTYDLPAKARVGGAAIIVTDVDQFYKL